jgi:urease accessory protein
MRQRHWAVFALISSTLAPLSASAHHPMEGQTPATVLQGLLSGLGHPVIELDHLAFVLAAGLIVAMGRRTVSLAAAFVIASMAATLARAQGLQVPAGELWVAASLAVAGAVMLSTRRWPAFALLPLLVAGGLAHGYAYGEAIVGAEQQPLVAYLAGLAAIQFAMMLGVARAAAAASAARVATARRWSGITVAAAGMVSFMLGVY